MAEKHIGAKNQDKQDDFAQAGQSTRWAHAVTHELAMWALLGAGAWFTWTRTMVLMELLR